MSRLPTIDPTQASGEAKIVLDETAQLFGGAVPNLMRTMANSPAVLRAWLETFKALSARFDDQLRAQIAITVAQANACDYCLSANTYFGKAAGLSDQAAEASRDANSTNLKTQALLHFTQAMVALRGEVTDSHLADVRRAGWNDAEIAEVIGLIAMNTLMNYINNAANTQIDFPALSVTERSFHARAQGEPVTADPPRT